MRDFFKRILHELKAGRPVELVSVVEAGGSTPRGAGAMMAVFADGTTTGTVGGGNVEFASTKLAADLLVEGNSAIRHFRFVPGDAASLGMVCGGDVTVQFQYLRADDEDVQTVLQDLLEATGGNLDTWLVRKIDDGVVTAMGLADRNGLRYLSKDVALPRGLLQHKGMFQDHWFAAPVVKAGRVYIFGGGHVAQALVPAIAAVGFRPVVYDDRREFTDPRLFPQAEQLLCGSFLDLSEKITITPDDYVVIMTRGHQADFEVLTQVLRSGARYLGCIGSRKKLAFCLERLIEAGFTQEEYARVHAPIGLAIGAETPAEIAVSITAELIAVRAGKDPK